MKRKNAWGISRKSDLFMPGDWFGVSEIACELAARQLRVQTIDIDVTGSWDTRTLTEKFFFISVCHQINWDYMEGKFAEILHPAATPAEISSFFETLTVNDFSRYLCDYEEQSRVRAKERTEILRGVAAALKCRYDGDFFNLIQAAGSRLDGVGGIYSRLDEFPAFSADPLRKKSNVLVHEIQRSSGFELADTENMRPAIDYHIIRSYLRSGRIFPKNLDILERLKDHDPAPRKRVVDQVRSATSDALTLVARYSGLSVAEVNYREWMIARSRCIRSSPQCKGPLVHSSKNKSDSPVVGIDECPFAPFCAVNWLDDWEDIWEPIFISQLY